MATDGGNKWIWITVGIVVLLLIVVGIYAFAYKAPTTGTPPMDNTGGTTPSETGPAPGQTLKKYPCETRKVCQGRGGYANWVKTGTQKKCNASNASQLLCINDCLGTCYTWE